MEEKKIKGTISLEEHKEFGRMCSLFHHKLLVDGTKYYPKALYQKSYEKNVVKALSTVRNLCEEILFRDFFFEEKKQNNSTELINIYYGKAIIDGKEV